MEDKTLSMANIEILLKSLDLIQSNSKSFGDKTIDLATSIIESLQSFDYDNPDREALICTIKKLQFSWIGILNDIIISQIKVDLNGQILLMHQDFLNQLNNGINHCYVKLKIPGQLIAQIQPNETLSQEELDKILSEL